MFYASEILARKGPLSHVWLAAHMDRKLSKSQIVNTSIPGAVADILNPSDKLALRLSSHLMLGVVKIYQRKAQYLLVEAGDAVYKIKTAFRQGDVDLPLEHRVAPLSSITMTSIDSGVDLAILLRVQAPELGGASSSSSSSSSFPADKSLMSLSSSSSSSAAAASAGGAISNDLSATLASIFSEKSNASMLQKQKQQKAQQQQLQQKSASSFGGFDLEMTADENVNDASVSMEVGRDVSVHSDVGFAQPIITNTNTNDDMDKQQVEEPFFDYGYDPSMYNPPPGTPPRDAEVPILADQTFATPLRDAQVPAVAPATPASNRKRKMTVVDEKGLVIKEYRNWMDDTHDLLRVPPTAAGIKDPSTLAKANLFANSDWIGRSLIAPTANYFRRRAETMFVRPETEEEEEEEEEGQEEKGGKKAKKAKQAAEDEEQEEDQLPPKFKGDMDVEAGRFTAGDISPIKSAAPLLPEGYDTEYRDYDGGVPFGGHEYTYDMEERPSPKRKTLDEQQLQQEDEEEEAQQEQAQQVPTAEAEKAQTEKIATFLRNEFKSADKLSVMNLLHGKKPKSAAGLFYELLVLKTQTRVQVEQEEPYGDIEVTLGARDL